ncbi:MAG: hypothetical protein ACK50Z_17525, partial [Betaproteobacteria bacterium]
MNTPRRNGALPSARRGRRPAIAQARAAEGRRPSARYQCQVGVEVASDQRLRLLRRVAPGIDDPAQADAVGLRHQSVGLERHIDVRAHGPLPLQSAQFVEQALAQERR